MSAGEITHLLRQAEQGDAEAANRLFSLVQDDLKAIAAKQLRGVVGRADVSATMVVDEAFARLVGKGGLSWENGDRGKFFGYVATKMHDLLIEKIRSERAVKRGGRQQFAADLDVDGLAAGSPLDDLPLLLDLHAALDKLQPFAPAEARAFRLRFFLGCTFDEVAALMNLSATTAKRHYAAAQMWLRSELKDYQAEA